MSKFILYFFAIIFFVSLFKLVFNAPGQKLNTDKRVQIYQTKPIVKVEDDEQQEETEDDENDDEVNDTSHDDSIDAIEPNFVPRRSNSVRMISMNLKSRLLIGFILCFYSFELCCL
ncbi:unnamed protein product [Rotaria magnacalcarata]|uniref:Uncharacterized protein n=1 Tax=Rotaria magnacalcarata TaxID=392030 RepID=A0A816BNQ4_9BILA|nr:unnamed protein product [Rotaria magnacalcarata]CAF1610036.1 unnamed protein product [Rotaria magnacalcarata]